ncbi:hypothetical protein TorRG33x02_105400, partial [Trema orientale]
RDNISTNDIQSHPELIQNKLCPDENLSLCVRITQQTRPKRQETQNPDGNFESKHSDSAKIFH